MILSDSRAVSQRKTVQENDRFWPYHHAHAAWRYADDGSMATRRQNRHRWRGSICGSVHGVIFDDKGIVQDIEYQNLAGPWQPDF